MEKDEAGSTRKDRLLQYYKTTGEMPQLLNEVDLDFRVEPWYDAFLSLNSYRHADIGGMGGAIHQPLTAREILDWVELENQTMNPFGLSVIKSLDLVFLEFKNKQKPKKPKASGKNKRGRT